MKEFSGEQSPGTRKGMLILSIAYSSYQYSHTHLKLGSNHQTATQNQPELNSEDTHDGDDNDNDENDEDVAEGLVKLLDFVAELPLRDTQICTCRSYYVISYQSTFFLNTHDNQQISAKRRILCLSRWTIAWTLKALVS